MTSLSDAQVWQLSSMYGLRCGLDGSTGCGGLPILILYAVSRSRALRDPAVWNAVVATGPSSSTMCVQPSVPPSRSRTARVKPLPMRSPISLLKFGCDIAAHPVRRLVGHGFDIDDGEAMVDREADRHVVHELAGLQRPAPFVGMLVGLLVGDATLDIVESVVAVEALAGDLTRMQMLSPDWRRKRHGTNLSKVDFG